MRATTGALILALTACSMDVPTTGWPFDPVEFFAGRSHGEGTLRILFGSSRHISVDSIGTPDGHGGFILNQRIREQGKAQRTRRWVLHAAGTNRWIGTLTDAEGPVTIERTLADVTIRYRSRSGQQIKQSLERPPSGLVGNYMTVSKWGIELATLDETIRKLD